MLPLASIVAVLMSGEVMTHRIDSPRQSAPTDVRVVVPDQVAAGEKLRVVYLLPVEPGRERRYGDGLETALEFDAANKFRVVLVAPSFAALPWYADHPSDPRLAQESYFLQEVVPFVEANYPVVAERRGRLLCGFSKSGWGAWCLLLRHPDTFDRAAAWDAPLTMDAPGKYGSGQVFGTPENFAHYQITKLLDERAVSVSERGAERLILLARGNFPDDVAIHERLQKLGVPHVYRDDLKTKHVWSRDWLEPALESLTR